MKLKKEKDGLYLARFTSRGTSREGSRPLRSWFLVKHKHNGAKTESGVVDLRDLHLPPDMIGKRLKFKVQILKEDEKK